MFKPLTALFILSVLVPSFAFEVFPASAESYVHRSYTWQYGGLTWTWAIDIPQSLYNGYTSVSQYNRRLGEFNGYLVTTKDPLMQSIATAFRKTATDQGYDAYDEASLLLAWVQSLPYTFDSVTSPYDDFPRFPVETLYANGGDCEDTTYLYLTIMRIWGYGSIFINPEGHLAPGILAIDSLPGYYWEYDGRKYYYAETVGDGWRIGDIPNQYRGYARLYPITVEGYVPDWSGSTPTNDPNTSTPNQDTQNTSNPFADLLNSLFYPLTFFILAVVIAIGATIWEEAKKRKAVAPLGTPAPLTACQEQLISSLKALG